MNDVESVIGMEMSAPMRDVLRRNKKVLRGRPKNQRLRRIDAAEPNRVEAGEGYRTLSSFDCVAVTRGRNRRRI